MAHLRNTETQLKPTDSSEALMQLDHTRRKSTDQLSLQAASLSPSGGSSALGWKPLGALNNNNGLPKDAMSSSASDAHPLSRSSSQEELPVLSTNGYHVCP
jgi:hypothetical protein